MKAMVMSQPGSPEVLELQDLPVPQLQSPADMLVRVYAAGVNPVDTKIRQRGAYCYPERPAVLGLDGAGVVAAVGNQVRRFSPGDAVYFCHGGLGGSVGTYAEYIVIPADLAAPKPQRLDFATAAAAPLGLITAWESLYDRGRLSGGQTVLIHAGAGGVGHIALQLAKLRDAKVCTTISTEAKANFVTQLGADHCIYYPRIDFVSGVMSWTGNRGVDLAFDTVGEPILSQTFAAVRPYGSLVTLHSASTDTAWKVARDRNLSVNFELTLTPMLEPMVGARHHQVRILKQCARWIDAGKLQVQLSHSFSLEEAAAAHALLESGGMVGKAVLKMPLG